MTDTQPTKFCVECKWCGGVMSGYPCFNPKQDAEHVSLVTGRTTLSFGIAREVRTNMCHGEWWEEMPKPEPEPEESRYVFFDDKPIGRYTPSLIQRIKRWFG